MPDVTITLQPGDIQVGTPLAVDILDFDLDMQWRGTMVVGTALPVPFSMKPGDYVVQVGLPSGDTATAVITVGEEVTAFDIALPRGEPAAHAPETPVAHLDSVWLRLWKQGAAGRWRSCAWPSRPRVETDGSATCRLRLDAAWREWRRPCFLQFGGWPTYPRLMALPADDVTLVLRPVPGVDPDDRAQAVLAVEVRSSAPEADALLSYLSHGDLRGARVVGRDALVNRLVEERADHPVAAALAAYHLLSIRRFDRLDDLLDGGLSGWSGALPDGAVVAAWRALRQPDPDPAKARASLLEAVRRGVPLYTGGLRLLLDGLCLFEADPACGGGEVGTALANVRRFAAAVADWRSPFTTFFGFRPDKPIVPNPGFGWIAERRKAEADPHNVFPWMPERPWVENPERVRGEMAAALSHSFLQAFALPRAKADLETARRSFDVFRHEFPIAFGAQP